MPCFQTGSWSLEIYLLEIVELDMIEKDWLQGSPRILFWIHSFQAQRDTLQS